MFLAHPSGDKALVGHRNGLIELLSLPTAASGQSMAVLSTFLDLRGRVGTRVEQGMERESQ